MHETLVIMRELRLQIVGARSRLRRAKDRYELERAAAEQRAIDAGCGGKNAEERSRALLLAIAKDGAYTNSLDILRCAEAELDQLDALLESARDERRADEWRIRARMVEALERAGVQSNDPAEDDVFDIEIDRVFEGYPF